MSSEQRHVEIAGIKYALAEGQDRIKLNTGSIRAVNHADNVFSLEEIEDLCRCARAMGMTDKANFILDYDSSYMTLRAMVEQTFNLKVVAEVAE